MDSENKDIQEVTDSLQSMNTIHESESDQSKTDKQKGRRLLPINNLHHFFLVVKLNSFNKFLDSAPVFFH